jgi:high-affinity nickel permease
MKIGDNMIKYTWFYNLVNPIILAIIILLTMLSFTALSSAAADHSALMKLISQNEDPRMEVKDLAFFLVTHDFDAVPKKDHVEVIDGTVYKLMPNGQYRGLANETIVSR